MAATSTLNFPPAVPNAECHYAVGDIASWTGIKRVGNAIAMGGVAGHNIYQSLLMSEAQMPRSPNISADSLAVQLPTPPGSSPSDSGGSASTPDTAAEFLEGAALVNGDEVRKVEGKMEGERLEEKAKSKFLEFPKVPPMLALAIGEQAVAWRTGGEVEYGKEVGDLYFAGDLGLKGCWDAMGLDALA